MRKNGIMIMSGFAALWFVWGLSALHSVPAAVLLVPVAISGTQMVFAQRLPGHASEAERNWVRRVVGRASLAEFFAILAANLVLGMTAHADFAVCATAGIVGLHFLPLAHFLRVPRYYWVGSALVALALAGCAAGDAETRLMIVAFGSAVLLWITCLTSFTHKAQTGFLPA